MRMFFTDWSPCSSEEETNGVPRRTGCTVGAYHNYPQG